MNDRRQVVLELACAVCLLAASVLLYLDWWRNRELEDMSRRVSELELARQKRQRRTTATEGAE